jgi:hypothetical protein
MLRNVLFDMDLFSDESEEGKKNSQERVLFLLQALVNCNRLYLRLNPNTPWMYQSGIKYTVPEPMMEGDLPEVKPLRDYLNSVGAPGKIQRIVDDINGALGGGEHFREIPRIIENGGGDCFPLAQKIIVRSRSTGMYELLALGELRHVYQAYEALSYNFTTCKYEFKQIIGFVDKGVKKVSRARLSNGTDLVATDDHKFWTLNGSRQVAPYPDSFALGVRTMGEYVEHYADFKKGRLSKGQRGVRARIIQASRIPALNTVRPSQAEAYLAGIYAAEGNFDGKHTCIAQHKPHVREKIEASLAETGTSFRYREGGNNGKTTPGSGAYYALHGGADSSLVAMMRGQGANSFDKRLPREFLSGDEQTVSVLLEGHGDGDAWRPANGAFKRPGVEAIYATSSDELMEQLRLGTLILGRPHYAYQYENHMGSGTKPIWRLHEYNEHASKLQARAALLDEDLPGLKYGTVRKAEPFGTAHVGCIEVEGNHNFFLADGTLASNCDNVASWRAAELNERLGIPARPYITWRKRADGGTTYHVIVLWPDGSSEDPSLLLGMGGEAREPDRQEELRKLRERAANVMQALQLGRDPHAALVAPNVVLGDLPNRSRDPITFLGKGGLLWRR